MQLKDFHDINLYEFKLFTYFLYLVSTTKPFNFEECSKIFLLSKEEIFIELKRLWEKNIIEFTIYELKNKSDLICNINNSSILLNITQLNSNDLKYFNVAMFEDREEAFKELVNKLYIPINRFDGEYMSDYVDETKKKPVEIEKISTKNYEKEREKKKERERLRRNASRVVDIFYSEFLKRYPRVILTPEQRKEEEKVAQIFIRSRENLDFDEITEGILWFFDDPFWNKVIINITGLNKHFSKFLVQKEHKTKTDLRFI